MSAARDVILASIRAALVSPGDPRAEIPRRYKQAGLLTPEHRIALFTNRLHDYDARVYSTPETRIAQTIAAALTRQRVKRLVIPHGIPPAWLPPNFDMVPDESLSHEVLDRTDGVITTCTIAIALTGTIILKHGPGQGRRALTLIPDYHLCVVRAAQILETVPEAIRFLNATAMLPTTTISGPSATADIEMTRIKGVHGPRTLDVVLVE